MSAPYKNALGKWTCPCELNSRFPWVACQHIRAARKQEAVK